MQIYPKFQWRHSVWPCALFRIHISQLSFARCFPTCLTIHLWTHFNNLSLNCFSSLLHVTNVCSLTVCRTCVNSWARSWIKECLEMSSPRRKNPSAKWIFKKRQTSHSPLITVNKRGGNCFLSPLPFLLFLSFRVSLLHSIDFLFPLCL